jgi:D-proline reductase (dithiol) PrdB
VTGPSLSERRVSILSTAALNLRSDAGFFPTDAGYRVIPGNVDPKDVVMSHVSSNFDRSGFQRDLNVCFPIDRLRELADEGIIGSVSNFHFSVLGSRPPLEFEQSARDIARVLKADGVDAVILVPI